MFCRFRYYKPNGIDTVCFECKNRRASEVCEAYFAQNDEQNDVTTAAAGGENEVSSIQEGSMGSPDTVNYSEPSSSSPPDLHSPSSKCFFNIASLILLIF